MATASELADHLAREIPVYGAISRKQAERILFRRGGVTMPQIQQAIIIAISRRQVVAEHGGATLSRATEQRP